MKFLFNLLEMFINSLVSSSAPQEQVWQMPFLLLAIIMTLFRLLNS